MIAVNFLREKRLYKRRRGNTSVACLIQETRLIVGQHIPINFLLRWNHWKVLAHVAEGINIFQIDF